MSMNTSPSVKCPHCKQGIKVERRGKQRCLKCGRGIEVQIWDEDVDYNSFGSRTDTRTKVWEG